MREDVHQGGPELGFRISRTIDPDSGVSPKVLSEVIYQFIHGNPSGPCTDQFHKMVFDTDRGLAHKLTRVNETIVRLVRGFFLAEKGQSPGVDGGIQTGELATRGTSIVRVYRSSGRCPHSATMAIHNSRNVGACYWWRSATGQAVVRAREPQ